MTNSVINNLINKNRPQNKIDNLKVDSQSEDITDPTEIARIFNSFFTNIGPDLASKIVKITILVSFSRSPNKMQCF